MFDSRQFFTFMLLPCLMFAPTISGPLHSQDPTAQTENDSKKDKKQQEEEKKEKEVGKGINWYSIEKEIAIGKAMAQQVESQSKILSDPVITEFVNRVGQNLVRNSDAKVPFTIKVIDSDEINAFALPGGFFYVNTGVLFEAEDESELAGVMAHEIAHVAARHGTRGATRGEIMNLARLGLIFVPGVGPYIAYQASGLLIPMSFLKFSRGFEREADELGLKYMYKTGYDPTSFTTFFERIQAKEKRRAGSLSKLFSSHPQTPDRIKKTQEEIAKLPARDEHIVTTSEFDDVKARLEILYNRKNKGTANDPSKPTLRRTATASDSKDDSKDKNKDEDKKDDRPTLKRRDPN